MTADDKYSCDKRKNILQPIQLILFKKLMAFYRILMFEMYMKFRTFWKQMSLIA